MKRTRPKRAYRLEALERRDLLTTFGVPWADARHLTISFVPDGTQVAGQASNLFATLNAQDDTASWQAAILSAFQTWAVNANIDVGVVPDDGEPLGTPGKTEGDSRFGDIRIAAQPMSSSALSVSVPHDPFLSGTWDGDVLLNSTIDYRDSQSDLFSVMLHEAGHVFGLEGNDDPNSVMYEHADGVRSSLADSDIAAIQALYGQRSADANEGSGGNDRFNTATHLQPPSGSSGGSGGSSGGGSSGGGSSPGGSTSTLAPMIAFGDITTAKDVDDFAWQVPSNVSGPASFRLQSAGISLLAPQLMLYDSGGRSLGRARSTSAAGDVLTINLDHVTPGSTIYAQVSGASSDPSGIGRYGLAVVPGGLTDATSASLDAVLRGHYETLSQAAVDQLLQQPDDVLFNDDAGTDDTLLTATTLLTTPGYAKQTHYEALGSLGTASEVDVYRIKAASVANGQPNVLTATLTAVAPNGAVAQVTLLDELGNVVPSRILANGNGTYTIQAENLKSGGNYFLSVSANPSSASSSVGQSQTGNYSLVASFGATTEQLTTFAADTVASPTTANTAVLYVAQDQLFQFLLSAGSTTASEQGSVTMTIADSAGNTVFTLAALAGQMVSGDAVLLKPGQYFVTFGSNETTAPIDYSLTGIVLTDPLGPPVNDPTLTPIYTNPADPGVYYYPPPVPPTPPVNYVPPPPYITPSPYLFVPWPGYPYSAPPTLSA
ncbi:MAG TPA: matrixin family metalloprotease [Pirellulales bacterium]|nr:matrixin family metalloprotease [Pirellulales bacterium]